MTPTAILKTLETGVMRTQAAALSSNERQAVANFLGTGVTTERRLLIDTLFPKAPSRVEQLA